MNRRFPEGDWEDIYIGTPATDTVAVLVTGPPSSKARLRIMSQLTPAVYDLSDNDFTIDLRGGGLIPGLDSPVVVAYRQRNDIVLHWNSVGALYYLVYSSSEPSGQFSNLEGVTKKTFFVDEGVLQTHDSKFYQVRSSTTLP